MAGYTRQSIADIIPGEDVRAEPLNAEFNRLQLAFGTTGHTHDGTAGNGPPINLANSVIGILPPENGGIYGKSNINSLVDPTVNDDVTKGYVAGSVWVNTAANRPYIMVNNQQGAAVWRLIQSPTGTFLQPDNNLSDVANISTARSNLNAQLASTALSTISTVTGADQIPYSTGNGAYGFFTSNAFSRSIFAQNSAFNWKNSLGLQNVDNTSDAGKPVSTATQSALDLKAPLASPALTGTPTTPTATLGTNTTQIASTAFVQSALTTVSQAPIYPIVITSPASGTVVTATQTFTAGVVGYPADPTGYYSLYGFNQASRTLNVYAAATPNTVAGTLTINGIGNSVTANLQTLGLSINTNYLAELVFTDILGNTAKTAKSAFTTPAQFKPNVGQAYQGGFLAFENFGDGGLSDLVVAPKSTEASKTWSGSSSLIDGMYSRLNGAGNTSKYVSVQPSTANAAGYARSISIGGVAGDLGATDQLRCILFNLKSSVAVEAAFKAGGSEVFGPNWLWASTEVTASNAGSVYGADGAEGSTGKSTSYLVRAIKSVAVTPPIALGTYLAAQGGWLAAYFTDMSSGTPVTYGLIVSDKAVEVTRAWGPSSTTSFVSRTNGNLNYSTNIVDGSYPALFYCYNLVHGGKDDWYLGAIDEMLAIARMNANLPSGQRLLTSQVNYSTSTEVSASTFKRFYFDASNIIEADGAKSDSGISVRPIRRVPLAQLAA